MAGASPNDTMSARLSYSLPKALSVFVSRARRPSSVSKIIAMNTANARDMGSAIRGQGDEGMRALTIAVPQDGRAHHLRIADAIRAAIGDWKKKNGVAENAAVASAAK